MSERVRYCKKCGCELSPDTKGNKCDNCRRETASTVRKVFLGLFAAGATAGITYNTISNQKSANSEEDDDNDEEC